MRNSPRKNKGFQGWYLRNAVPARGRKPLQLVHVLNSFCKIWEMQSPQGDGNKSLVAVITKTFVDLRNAVPARGRKLSVQWRLREDCQGFEKCSPRKGTETNWYTFQTAFVVSYLRNAVPARGRKLFHFSSPSLTGCNIWEMQSPQGDGNRQCNNW